MISIPVNCPSCGEAITLKNDILYCLNDDCDAKNKKSVEHFAKTLKIKGLGPASISKIGLDSISDIYQISMADISDKLGSQKLAEKLYQEIEKTKLKSLNEVLPALGIPLIGKTATDKLSKVCKNIYDINQDTCRLAGLGPIATENILQAIEKNLISWETLPISLEFQTSLAVEQTKGVVCITGKLTSYKTKALAIEKLEELGYTVKSTVTKDVTILINESGKETSKTEKARKAGITIIEDVNDLINKE